MGLFDRFKNREEPKEETDVTMYSVPLSDGKNEIQVNALTRSGKFRHRDNSRTDLIMGRAIITRPGDAVFFDSMDYIAFEIPSGQLITEDDVYAAVEQYVSMKYQTQSQSKAFYAGQIQDGEVIGRSSAVEQYVGKAVAQMEASREQEFKARMEKNEIERAARRERERAESEKQAAEYEARRAQVRNARKQNANLTMSASGYEMQGKIYSDYDGVDMLTGDIMRLRQVNKVGKDAEGNYLYSGFVDTVESDQAMELFAINEEPPGDYICFTLPGRLEDIARSGDMNQIRSVLDLLSVPRASKRELTYIGGLDRYGQISRDSMPKSAGIASKVTQMKQEYAAKLQQFNKRDLYSSGDER